jgi:hypothetical protein
MEEETNVDKLRALAQQLIGLLDANEVGLHTWHEAVEKKLDEIAALSSYRPAVRDAHALLRGISLSAAQEWVQTAERLGLVEQHARRQSDESFILAPFTRSTRVRRFE